VGRGVGEEEPITIGIVGLVFVCFRGTDKEEQGKIGRYKDYRYCMIC